MVNIMDKDKTAIFNCLDLIKSAVAQGDKDMLRSYFEQLNDLVVEVLEYD